MIKFKRAIVAMAAGLTVLSGFSAEAARFGDRDSGVREAETACLAANDYGPTQAVGSVEDGLGDYVVWVEDTDGDLWLCNADAQGEVYLNVMLQGDLLEGAGGEFLQVTSGPGALPGAASYPADQAARVCLAFLEEIFWGEGQVMASVPDGMGDYLVWLEDENADLYACNASSYGALYMFEPLQFDEEYEGV